MKARIIVLTAVVFVMGVFVLLGAAGPAVATETESLAGYTCEGTFESLLSRERGEALLDITDQVGRRFTGQKTLMMFGAVHDFMIQGTMAASHMVSYIGWAADAHLVVHGTLMEDGAGAFIVANYLLMISGLGLDKGLVMLACSETME